jgi:molybdate transport system substrate-binding protein
MLSPGTVEPAEITVLAGQGVVSAVRDLAPAFERASGHKVVVSFEVGPGLMNKVNSDAPADVVTHYPEMIDDLIKKGKVLAGTGVAIARAGIGVAVRAGAPTPDISSTDAFKRSMLAAKSVAYSRAGASGLYAAKLMEGLGIADEMKSRTKLVDGVPVAEVVAKGEAEIGMQQINVILPVAGIHYVSAAARAAGLRCVLRRRVGGIQGTGGGDRDGEVHVRAGTRTAHQKEWHGARRSLSWQSVRRRASVAPSGSETRSCAARVGSKTPVRQTIR